ncbi:hypothetical protein GmHk_U059935 [Glycine max]|nr:hypothetical protein GmHk_U059935 [Glycine max]
MHLANGAQAKVGKILATKSITGRRGPTNPQISSTGHITQHRRLSQANNAKTTWLTGGKISTNGLPRRATAKPTT